MKTNEQPIFCAWGRISLHRSVFFRDIPFFFYMGDNYVMFSTSLRVSVLWLWRERDGSKYGANYEALRCVEEVLCNERRGASGRAASRERRRRVWDVRLHVAGR